MNFTCFTDVGHHRWEEISLFNYTGIDVEKIQFRTFNFTSYNRTHNPQNLFDFSKLRLKVQISDVRSKFVSISIHMDVSYLTSNQKLYLPLLLSLWPHSPIKKNGSITSEEDMPAGLLEG